MNTGGIIDSICGANWEASFPKIWNHNNEKRINKVYSVSVERGGGIESLSILYMFFGHFHI